MSLETYFEEAQAVLRAISAEEVESLQTAARLLADVVESDGLIYTFGTGHSSLLAAEGLFRAGGLACVSAILEPAITFESGAVTSSSLERQQGLAKAILARYPIGEKDSLVIFSNSGTNAVPVETAQEGKRRGATVVAVTSRQYAARAPLSSSDKQALPDVADIVIDNHVPAGDAVVPFRDSDFRAASISR